jgi:hypothetical protein
MDMLISHNHFLACSFVLIRIITFELYCMQQKSIVKYRRDESAEGMATDWTICSDFWQEQNSPFMSLSRPVPGPHRWVHA